MAKENTILTAVKMLLEQEKRPMHYMEITKEILARGLWETKGAAPHNTVLTVIRRDDIEAKAASSVFKRTGPGTFALRAWPEYAEYGQVPLDVSLRIDELIVENFRCFEKQAFKFTPAFNILIGDNGAGKTAILDALAIALGAFLQEIGNVEAPILKLNDVRLRPIRKGDTLTAEPQFPVSLTCSSSLPGQTIQWERRLSEPNKTARNQQIIELKELANLVRQQVSAGENTTLPVIAYYRTDRLWRLAAMNERAKIGSRFDGYKDCLAPGSHTADLIEWMIWQETITLQERTSDPLYPPVKAALVECVEGWVDIVFHARERKLQALFQDGRLLPFDLLSDGQRNMLGMIADIAYRCALLNPHLAEHSRKDTSGVVLIDEIDLHLHPKWQRSVIENLRHTFPQIQFIATTHSPFIIQSLRPGELIDLTRTAKGEYVNRSLEDIVETVMNIPVPQRSQRYQKMYEVAQEYYRLLGQGKMASAEQVEAIKQKLNELVEPFSDNVAYYAFLGMKRAAAGLGGNDHETD